MTAHISRQRVWRGVEGIDLAQRHIATDKERLLPQVLRQLVVVEIHRPRRGHDDVMTFGGSLETSLVAAPAHDNGTSVDITFGYLVPTNQPAPFLRQILFHPAHHIALQLRLGLQALLTHPLLTAVALLPPHTGSLVATQMDIGCREEFCQFVDDVFQKTIDLVVARTENVVEHAPVGTYLVGAARTTQFRICRQRRQHVAGHIDLGNDGDMALLGVGHNLADVVLREIATVRGVFVDAGITAYDRPVAHRSHRRQLRPTLHLYAPALVVGQMEMQRIHSVQRHHVQILLHHILAEKVARHIQVHSPVGKARRTLDDGIRQRSGIRRQHLTQSLTTVEQPRLRASFQHDATLADRHTPTLWRRDVLVQSLRHLRLTVDVQHRPLRIQTDALGHRNNVILCPCS